MARLAMKLAGYPWDHLMPRLTGEVVPEGIDLQYDVHHAHERVRSTRDMRNTAGFTSDHSLVG
jgi:hypothetical protein